MRFFKTLGLITLIAVTSGFIFLIITLYIQNFTFSKDLKSEQARFNEIEKSIDLVEEKLEAKFIGIDWHTTKSCSQLHGGFGTSGDIYCQYGIISTQRISDISALALAIESSLNIKAKDIYKSEASDLRSISFLENSNTSGFMCELKDEYSLFDQKDISTFTCRSKTLAKWYISSKFGEQY